MKSVYIVTVGEYSNYRITAVFSTEKAAIDYMKAFPASRDDGYNELEEFELDPKSAALAAKGFFSFEVFMLRDGTVESVIKTPMPEPTGFHVYKRNEDYYGEKKTDVFIAVIMAKDENHAIKIANEKRAQLIAMDKF